MLKVGFVLLYTVYTSGVPDTAPPTFFATQEACEATMLEIKHRAAMRRRTTVDGGCFNMQDPRIRAYLREELEILERN